MAAIITEQFRINSRKRLFDDITNNANNYYIGIGKQDGWAELNPSQTVPTSPFPAGTPGDAAEVRKNISALFKISGSSVSTMLPNNIIQSDRDYKVYNPYDPTCFYASSTQFPCFVISRLDSLGGGSGNHVFLCVAKDHDATFASNSYNRIGSPSEVPSTTVPGLYKYSISNGGDGYIWLYIGTYEAANTSVNNGAFVSYDFGQTVTATPFSSGLIHGFHIINAGVNLATGPSTAVNVEITGLRDGSKTTMTVPALLKIVNGKITKITLNADITVGTTYKLWSSATARITTSGYTTTQIVPIIAPIGGYESKLETTLPSWYIGVGADTVNSQFVPSGTSYRQISIIKNPKRNNNNNLDDATVDRVHKSFSTSENGYPANERLVLSGNNVDTGWKIKQGNYLVATISAVEFKDNVWYYYYYNSIQAGLFNIDHTQSLTIVAPDDIEIVNRELTLLDNQYELNASSTLFNTSTGEILFIDNRGAVTREAGQNEEIKIIIQL
jgi:hypothetical protein